jgi:hypothetical protein
MSKTTTLAVKALLAMVLVAASLPVQAKSRVGTLSCDVSAGIGLIIFQSKQ